MSKNVRKECQTIPGDMSEDMPMPEDLLERMFEGMPERMSEEMSENMVKEISIEMLKCQKNTRRYIRRCARSNAKGYVRRNV